MAYDDDWQGMMDLDRFWRTLELTQRSYDAFRDALGQIGRRELVLFSWTFEALATNVLRTREDDFPEDVRRSEDAADDYARWIVAQGRSTYESVIAGSALPHATRINTRASWEPANVHADRFGDELPPVGWDLPPEDGN